MTDKLTLPEVGRMTEDEARTFLEGIRWPNGPVCPHCGDMAVTRLTDAPRPGLFQCNGCRGQFTVTVGTIFEDSHIPLQKWVLAFALMCSSKKGISALQLQRNLGLGSYKSAWHMAHRIRHAMTHGPLRGLLRGTVEVDETYVGGKHRPGSKRGHGTLKTPVVALVARDGGARAFPVKVVDRLTLHRIIRENVAKETRLMTDELKSYRGLKNEYAAHDTVKHSAREYARGDAHINTAESFFALLKRGIYGTFHSISEKHLHRYANEFCFRWDHRFVNDGTRTVAALKASDGKRLMYRESVRNV